MRCRARLTPQDVGLPSVGRRRVPGLRREEVAELAGITPAWYTQLETGSDIRVSPRMLDRVASALRLSDEEKVYLFSLAIVELSALPCLQPQSHAVLEAFTSLRSLSRRLWVASTEKEVLTIAREHCARTFTPDATFSTIQTGLGRWSVHWTSDNATVRRTLEISEYVIANWPPALRDELHLSGILNRAGDVMTRSEIVPSSDFSSYFARTLDVVEWPALDHFMAAVHSRNGFVARLTGIYEKPQSHSKTDRAMMSAIAELTSLALADAPAASRQA